MTFQHFDPVTRRALLPYFCLQCYQGCPLNPLPVNVSLSHLFVNLTYTNIEGSTRASTAGRKASARQLAASVKFDDDEFADGQARLSGGEKDEDDEEKFVVPT